MKRIILFLSGISILGLASCTQVYPTREVNRSYYRSNSYNSSPRLGPAPSGGPAINAVGQPDSFSE